MENSSRQTEFNCPALAAGASVVMRQAAWRGSSPTEAGVDTEGADAEGSAHSPVDIIEEPPDPSPCLREGTGVGLRDQIRERLDELLQTSDTTTRRPSQPEHSDRGRVEKSSWRGKVVCVSGFKRMRSSKPNLRQVVLVSTVAATVCWFVWTLYGLFATLHIVEPAATNPAAMTLETRDFKAPIIVGLVGCLVGSIVFGHHGDVVSRQGALASALLLVSLVSLLMGVFPPSEHHVPGIRDGGRLWWGTLRFFQGMGLGGAWAGLLLFPMEICAADPCRALMGGLVATGVAAGMALANFVGYLLICNPHCTPIPSWQWRLIFWAPSVVLLLLSVWVWTHADGSGYGGALFSWCMSEDGGSLGDDEEEGKDEMIVVSHNDIMARCENGVGGWTMETCDRGSGGHELRTHTHTNTDSGHQECATQPPTHDERRDTHTDHHGQSDARVRSYTSSTGDTHTEDASAEHTIQRAYSSDVITRTLCYLWQAPLVEAITGYPTTMLCGMLMVAIYAWGRSVILCGWGAVLPTLDPQGRAVMKLLSVALAGLAGCTMVVAALGDRVLDVRKLYVVGALGTAIASCGWLWMLGPRSEHHDSTVVLSYMFTLLPAVGLLHGCLPSLLMDKYHRSIRYTAMGVIEMGYRLIYECSFPPVFQALFASSREAVIKLRRTQDHVNVSYVAVFILLLGVLSAVCALRMERYMPAPLFARGVLIREGISAGRSGFTDDESVGGGGPEEHNGCHQQHERPHRQGAYAYGHGRQHNPTRA